MFAAPASGTGKTTLVSGFLRALVARGLDPAAFKCGPDYIDPMFHRVALGVGGGNIDLFFTPPDVAKGLFRRRAQAADISVLEGVMGHYDGIGDSDRASGWRIASETRTPVALAVRPKGASLSLAALVKGFLEFRSDSMIRGIVLVRCRGKCADRLTPMLERETGVRVYGSLPEVPGAAIESRHLGLTTPDAVDAVRDKIRLLASEMEKTLDVPGLVELAKTAPAFPASPPDIAPSPESPVRIAVADDPAFCFYYRENLELLQALGAELAFFSPLRDAGLPGGIGGLYLGGGYPELHAGELAANGGMRRAVRDAVSSGMPTVAECGGFLYLLSGLKDGDGREHPMTGCLEGVAANAGRLRRFGYLTLTARRDSLLCREGETLPAHEFHYWDCGNPGDAFRAEKASGGDSWNCVVANASLYAGFPHLYFRSNPVVAGRFVVAAARWKGRAKCATPNRS
jgi:cobyrinic acid a,c-diamide synthase